MKKKYILDTNFILRYLLKDNKAQYQKSRELFDFAKEGKVSLRIEVPVFTEVIYVLSSYYKVPKDIIIDIMFALIAMHGVITDQNLLEVTLSIFKKNNIHIIDAFVIAKSITDCSEILSFDKKLLKISCAMAES